eukprot:619854-Pelagomonas_calceolata.AAC.2
MVKASSGQLRAARDGCRLPFAELANMEKEIDMLDRVWGLIREWQTLYATWKDGAFVDIEVRRWFFGFL